MTTVGIEEAGSEDVPTDDRCLSCHQLVRADEEWSERLAALGGGDLVQHIVALLRRIDPPPELSGTFLGIGLDKVEHDWVVKYRVTDTDDLVIGYGESAVEAAGMFLAAFQRKANR